MTDDRMALMEALQQADDGNFLRSLAETVLQILMEADRDGLIGAGRYERAAVSVRPGATATGTVRSTPVSGS